VVVAYTLLGVSWFVVAHFTRDGYWDPYHVGSAALWALCCVGLLLRYEFALFVLILFELVAMVGFVFEPGAWTLFALEAMLLFLVTSPQMQTYVRGRRPPVPVPVPARTDRIALVVILVGLALTVLVLALARDPAAIPLAVLGGVLLRTNRRMSAFRELTLRRESRVRR